MEVEFFSSDQDEMVAPVESEEISFVSIEPESVEPEEEKVEDVPDRTLEKPEEKAEPEPAPVLAKEKAPPAPERTAPVSPGKWVTRNQAFGLMFVGFIITLVLGLLLSLGILAAINNGQLQFAAPAQVNVLKAQADRLDTRASSIEQDLQGLRERIDQIEMLGSRVSEVEKATGQLNSDLENATGELRTDIESLSAEMGLLTDELDGYSAQIKALEMQGERFTGFLDGLRALLENLVSSQEGVK